MKSAQQKKVKELNSHYIEQQEIVREQKSKGKKGLVRRLNCLGIFVAIIILVTGLTLHSQASVLENKLEKTEQLAAEFAYVQLVERDLQDEIASLNNLEYISEIARRDYYLTKPGEIIFKVTTNSSD
jgi:cell division protein DivIC